MHRVICIMLAKGPISNDQLRLCIAQHIETADIPQCSRFSEETEMYTMNFNFVQSADVLPYLLTQLMEYCNSSSATRFDQPLVDGAGATVGFISLEPRSWQQILDVAMALGDRIQADAAKGQE